MPKNRRAKSSPKSRRAPESASTETRASEAITIAWTSSVTGVFVANALVIAAHFYAQNHPEAKAAIALEAIMLLSAAVMGAISLALLTATCWSRRVKPPQGFLVFAALVAAAPIVALLGRLIN